MHYSVGGRARSSTAELAAHNRLVPGSNPGGPIGVDMRAGKMQIGQVYVYYGKRRTLLSNDWGVGCILDSGDKVVCSSAPVLHHQASITLMDGTSFSVPSNWRNFRESE